MCITRNTRLAKIESSTPDLRRFQRTLSTEQQERYDLLILLFAFREIQQPMATHHIHRINNGFQVSSQHYTQFPSNIQNILVYPDDLLIIYSSPNQEIIDVD